MRFLHAPLAVLVLFAGSARAEDTPCKSCWNATCPDLQGLGLPKCAAPKKKSEPPPPPPPPSTPAPPTCPTGQARTEDTAGHCCWPGQVWTKGKCVGRPTACPAPLVADDAQCALPACTAGMERMEDGVHCCWPEQGWSTTQQRCVGKPACPAPLSVEGEGCVAPPPPATEPVVPPPPPPVETPIEVPLDPPPATAPAPASEAPVAEPAPADGDAAPADTANADGGDDGGTIVLIIVVIGVAIAGGVLLAFALSGGLDDGGSL